MMELIASLRAAIGDGKVLAGDAIPQHNWADAAEMPPCRPDLLVLPSSTEDVSRVLALCHAAGRAVVVQGGMSGLAGGAHPKQGEIALSLQNLRGIEDIDAVSRTMVVRAGTPLYQVQEAAAAAGLHYGVDLGARGSCTIGGNVATNAGGVQAVRYGVTRRQVLGLEAVLADGTVLSGLNRMMKNNTGYDWPQLMIGSEGTLGVITRVSLALSPAPDGFQTALLAVPDVECAAAIREALDRRFPARLVSFEGLWREYMDVTARLGTLPAPFAAACELVLLVELALGDTETAQEEMTLALSDLMEKGLIADALVAQSMQDRQRFWAYREANYEFDRVMPKAAHFDISLLISQMTAAVDHMRTALAARMPGGILVTYGHLGDGNLHIAIFPDRPTDDFEAAKAVVYDTVQLFGGSVSAEHGIGVLKRPYLGHSRTPAEIGLMRALKQTLDPSAILGRGRILATD